MAIIQEKLVPAQRVMPQTPSPVEDPSWPMRCICNLCECGEHRCSNFGLAASPSDKEQPRALQQMRHCCNYTAANERYLASAAGGAQAGPMQSSANEVADARRDELLHVLVARPELARPRDNIVFEGNMDLRTTFETSYEALARMRLDHWRRYQEQERKVAAIPKQQQQSQQMRRLTRRHIEDGLRGTDSGQVTSQDGEQQIETEKDADGHGSERALGSAMHTLPNVSKHLGNSGGPEIGAALLEEGTESAGGSESNERVVRIDPDDLTATTTHSPFPSNELADRARGEVICGDSVSHRPRLSFDERAESKQEQRQQTLGATTSASASAKAGIVAEAANLQSSRGHQLSQRQSQTQSRALGDRGDQYIDPDLSSIIIYDANMNRLERVGLRKRSKYRPSTSLRTGSRGLFGDQHESAPPARVEAFEGGESHNACQRCEHDVKSRVAGVTSQELDARCRSCNLKFSRELQSEHQNIPVESKRRVPDNANMVDHLRRDSLQEKRFKNKATLTDPMSQEQRQNEQAELPNYGLQSTLDPDDDRRLADAEEAAAVAEIQRCTLRDESATIEQNTQEQKVEQQVQCAKHQPKQSSSRNSARSAASSSEMQRQARMERMCQNQSFYLFDNEYPEPRGVFDDQRLKIGSGRDSGELVGHQVSLSPSILKITRERKNLFRESPDFILATGRRASNEQQLSGQRSNLKARGLVEPAVDDAKLAGSNGKLDSLERVEYAALGSQAKQKESELASAESAGKLQDRLTRAISPGGESNSKSEPETQNEGQHRAVCRNCRVFDLEQDFEFVGLRSGHKYFVERQYNMTPMSVAIKD